MKTQRRITRLAMALSCTALMLVWTNHQTLSSPSYKRAPPQPVVQSLEGTAWEAHEDDYFRDYYLLKEIGKAVHLECADQKCEEAQENEEGTWSQNGNSVEMQFSDFSIKASVSGTRMKGSYAFKKGKKKVYEWEAVQLRKSS
jgi:hypothetical protein